MSDEFHYTIRPYRADDETAVVRLMAELQDSLTPVDESLPSGSAMARTYFSETMERGRKHAGAILVADSDSRTIGFIAEYSIKMRRRFEAK